MRIGLHFGHHRRRASDVVRSPQLPTLKSMTE
jgi:hypothetical protein